ncbi:MAG: PfkB family carbohydrate kinase [Flaviflexus sp.]|uniref:PfkB family carbohydrate kinase n=1 Tax=Flaviflexus sp. TaxID=1969482 RepID=UPI003F934313
MTCLVVGESLVDVFTTEEGVVELPGGAPYNVARGLGMLGRRAYLATDLGSGDRAELLASTLAASKTKLWPGSRSTNPTSVAYPTIEEDGSPTYEFDLHFTPPTPPQGGTEEAAELVKVSPNILHTGSLAVHLAPEAIKAWINALSAVSTISYDPNYRESMGPHDEVLTRTEEFIGLSDVVKASRADITGLYPGLSEQAVITKWLSMGPQLVAITGGKDGAILATENLRIGSSASRVKAVDKVGAGDAFMSALIDALGRTSMLGAGSAESRRLLSERQLKTIAGYANAGGAIAVSRRGAVAPTRDELLDFVSSYSIGDV